ncbi:IclR family transcriptional regulator [Cupriavidus sp. 2TAF22]|uniref:IclR family transcriptional regulator n=1 Tax=unclassified Cupriavidus TaxID=2640874 RepID=UPI003F8F884D
MADSSGVADAGSLKRGVLLLKILASSGQRGLTLTQLAARAELPHPTAHRVLRQLVHERLVARNDELKRYRLGPLAYELGIAASTMYDLRDPCDDAMRTLASTTNDTVYLVVRSGVEAVCVHRIEGSFPIRALILDVGSRRPLGIGAGGLAILAATDEAERSAIIECIAARMCVTGRQAPPDLESACHATRERGFSVIHDRVNLGVTAVGLAFGDSNGRPLGALSVSALSHRMPAQRIERIAGLLLDACGTMERRIGDSRRSGWKTGGSAAN